MLTYELTKSPGVPLYEALYRAIRGDILAGKLSAGEKLPSKRALAANLEVSKITVETAYGQLLAEGYISAREKVGFFVEAVAPLTERPAPVAEETEIPKTGVDLTAGGPLHFPFSVWSRLQREVMLDHGEKLLQPLHHQGHGGLRRAIAGHLAGFRAMNVDPENIVIGAGTDHLYNLLIQLLGRHRVYAVEEPGYGKIRQIYAAAGAACVSAGLDGAGVPPENGDVLHISPSHHFPTGLVTPAFRRQELLGWAAAGDRWIIEDDYDSEFRFAAHPLPSLHTMDRNGRVIYMNTFSKSLAPSIRISYMVLPADLMARFRERLGFYSCTVTSFEQYTLERFLREGHFEKHINRMRKFYKNQRNRLVELLNRSPISGKITILEQNAGLHFLLRVDTDETDEALTARWAGAGIRVRALSEFYSGAVPPEDRHCLVVSYDSLTDGDFEELEQRLALVR